MKIYWNWLEGKNFESESRGWYEKMILRLLCGSWSWDHLTIYFQHIFPCLVCHCSFITSYMLFIWMCSWQCSCWDNTTWGESGIGSLLKAMNMAKNTGKRWKFISLSALSFLCKLLGSCTLLIFSLISLLKFLSHLITSGKSFIKIHHKTVATHNCPFHIRLCVFFSLFLFYELSQPHNNKRLSSTSWMCDQRIQKIPPTFSGINLGRGFIKKMKEVGGFSHSLMTRIIKNLLINNFQNGFDNFLWGSALFFVSGVI